jgi:pyruvate formate lyase activating enzyme
LKSASAADAAAPRQQAGSRDLQVGGLTPFTSIDFPGQLSAVVFVQGCPWRCCYCHNPHLQARDRAGGPSWAEVLVFLRSRLGLLDAVVFSGGEPTLDAALPQALADVRALGFKVGLHTAGIYPQRLQAVLPQLDWVGLDIKAPLARQEQHDQVSGVPGSSHAVRRSLAAVAEHSRSSGMPFECRTTAHPALLDDAALLELGDELAAAGVVNWALQIYRAQGSGAVLREVDVNYPSAQTWSGLRARLPFAAVRRA